MLATLIGSVLFVLAIIVLALTEKQTAPVGCLAGKSAISSPKGMMTIDQLQAGDVVWSWSLTGNQRCESQIRRIQAIQSQTVMSIVCDDASCLRATKSHTILTAQGWRKCGQISVGDRLIRVGEQANPVAVRVTRIEACGAEVVYRLYNTGPCNFLSDGFVSHSFSVMRAQRQALVQLQQALRRSHSVRPIVSEPVPQRVTR